MAPISHSGYRFPRDVIPACFVDVSTLHVELARCRGPAGGAWDRGVIRDDPALGRLLRTSHSAWAAGGAPRAASTMAPGRDVRPDRRQTDVPLESRRCRG